MSGAGWSLAEQTGEMNMSDIRMLVDSELDAVSGGDKTMGQVAAKVIAGTTLPDPPLPLQPCPGLHEVLKVFGSPF
jgi:hypothetical protein